MISIFQFLLYSSISATNVVKDHLVVSPFSIFSRFYHAIRNFFFRMFLVTSFSNKTNAAFYTHFDIDRFKIKSWLSQTRCGQHLGVLIAQLKSHYNLEITNSKLRCFCPSIEAFTFYTLKTQRLMGRLPFAYYQKYTHII